MLLPRFLQRTYYEPCPHITDGVIVLDGHTLADVELHLAGEDEEQARRFGWYPARSTPETVRAAIERWQESWRTSGPTRTWAIRDAGTGELAGGCELRLKDDGIAEMSYWVFPVWRRRGFASRAVRLVCRYAFDELGIERVELFIEPDSAAPRRAAGWLYPRGHSPVAGAHRRAGARHGAGCAPSF